MTFGPTSVEVTCVTFPKDKCIQVPWKCITVCGYSDPFYKNLNHQRLLTPRWPLSPHLLRSHVFLYPRIIVSKSHGDTLVYVDTVIRFAKVCKTLQTKITTYYINTTYKISDHIVDFWTKFRRDKNWRYSNGAVKLLSFCIGRRLLMLVFCVSIYVMHTNIRNAQSCYKRLALADVDWCTAMKYEHTISPHHGSICWSPALWSFIWELRLSKNTGTGWWQLPIYWVILFSVFCRCKQAFNLLRNTELMRAC